MTHIYLHVSVLPARGERRRERERGGWRMKGPDGVVVEVVAHTQYTVVDATEVCFVSKGPRATL